MILAKNKEIENEARAVANILQAVINQLASAVDGVARIPLAIEGSIDKFIVAQKNDLDLR